jgi:hypothetical protein
MVSIPGFGGFQLPDIGGMIRERIAKIFADIGEDTPIAYGIKEQSQSLVDLLDGVIHGIAELERRLPPIEDNKAA